MCPSLLLAGPRSSARSPPAMEACRFSTSPAPRSDGPQTLPLSHGSLTPTLPAALMSSRSPQAFTPGDISTRGRIRAVSNGTAASLNIFPPLCNWNRLDAANAVLLSVQKAVKPGILQAQRAEWYRVLPDLVADLLHTFAVCLVSLPIGCRLGRQFF